MPENLERRFMEIAFAEAAKVRGKTLPNPAVGAVLVKNGRIIARGGTRPAGQDHAEVVALKKAGAKALGATLYVTLEPCCHHGKTPPCTQALIREGVKKVVAACSDPNPKVAGKGFSELRRGGVEVVKGVLEERALEFYQDFSFFIRHGRPRIVVKIAQSLDGRINAAGGLQTRITGRESQRSAHALRAACDAILIGGKTLRIDNPRLTPRLVKGRAPEVLILTRGEKLDAARKLFSRSRAARTFVIAPRKIKGLPAWVEQISLPLSASSASSTRGEAALVRALLEIFKQRGYHSVLLEGGRSVWTPFLNRGLCDEFHLFTGPRPLPKGERWDSGLRSGWLKTLEFHRFTALGPDVLAEFRRA